MLKTLWNILLFRTRYYTYTIIVQDNVRNQHNTYHIEDIMELEELTPAHFHSGAVLAKALLMEGADHVNTEDRYLTCK